MRWNFLRGMRALGAVGLVAPLAAVFLMSACNGNTYVLSAPSTPTEPAPLNLSITKYEDLAGVNITITGVSGASGVDGTFQVGDNIAVTFTVTTDSGAFIRLDDIDRIALLVSGPTFNYQRVIAQKTDGKTVVTKNTDGSFTYVFADPIPATYIAPYNDTASFDAADGELTGQNLLAGTYTVGIEARVNYDVQGDEVHDVGNGTYDFLFGGAATLAPREVVSLNNCNQCHIRLEAHGGNRNQVSYCILCHTSGAEDKNDPLKGAGTPDTSIDFRVMIHKIHNGAHLPSVLGVTTDTNGDRDYTATPEPYLLAGYPATPADFSEVYFPVWPNFNVNMPYDVGYDGLSGTNKNLERAINRGVTACYKCHGDPDGAGSLTAPAQGDLSTLQPSRRACASCHTDVVWDRPYNANNLTMPADQTDSQCLICHAASGAPPTMADPPSTETAHLHPLLDPTFNAGFNFALSSVIEGGVAGVDNDDDGTIDPGETISITFTIKDDSGTDISPSTFTTNPSVVFSGPTENMNILLYGAIPLPFLTAMSSPYTINVPEQISYEYLGDSTGSTGDTWNASRLPVWDTNMARPVLHVRTALVGAAHALIADAPALNAYVDVDDSTGFATGDNVVIDDGMGGEEYMRIRSINPVPGDPVAAHKRIFLGTFYTTYPMTSTIATRYLRNSHTSATGTIQEVTLTAKTYNTDFTVNSMTGLITEVTEFGAGNAVILSYTTDFVMPASYPPPYMDSPNLSEDDIETWGAWKGKSIVDGTYLLGVWSRSNLTYTAGTGPTQNTSYNWPAVAARAEVLVGSADEVVSYDKISSGANCNACHDMLLFHGTNRKDFDTCILCHGTAGLGVDQNPVPDETANFRTWLHKFHAGTLGALDYTDDGDVFPALPGGVRNCQKCHGTADAWMEPISRDHPTEQGAPTRVWRATCGACHVSAAETAHINLQTDSSGAESCAVCHGIGADFDVELVHKVP